MNFPRVEVIGDAADAAIDVLWDMIVLEWRTYKRVTSHLLALEQTWLQMIVEKEKERHAVTN